MLTLVGNMFILSIKIGAPVVVAALITNVALNIVSRTVPQMNILVVGFPVTLAVGFLLMVMSMSLFGYLMSGVLGSLGYEIDSLLRSMGR
jgi:flagellar biosynthetic protein FliR